MPTVTATDREPEIVCLASGSVLFERAASGTRSTSSPTANWKSCVNSQVGEKSSQGRHTRRLCRRARTVVPLAPLGNRACPHRRNRGRLYGAGFPGATRDVHRASSHRPPRGRTLPRRNDAVGRRRRRPARGEPSVGDQLGCDGGGDGAVRYRSRPAPLDPPVDRAMVEKLRRISAFVIGVSPG